MEEPEAAVHRLLDGYAAAAHAKDADAFMRLYDPAVRVFDAWGVWSHDGAPAWREAVDGWFGSLGDERVAVRFADVSIVAGGSLAAMSAIVTYAALTASGEPLRAMDNRIGWVLRDDGRGFVVVHEHTSAPIGFDDGRAMLARPAAT